MGHSKQNKNQSVTSKDGKHRKETKEEKRARLQAEQEAREFCFKILPIAAGVVVFLLVAFALYVRSVPPKVIPQTMDEGLINDSNIVVPPTSTENMPPTDDPQLQEALREAMQALKDARAEEEEEQNNAAGETLEL